MKTHRIQCRESGDAIKDFESLEAAEKCLTAYENDDKLKGIFARKFYEIVELVDGVPNYNTAGATG